MQKSLWVLTAISASVGISFHVVADEQQSNTNTEVITVTAQGKPQDINDIAVSINVVPGGDIEQFNLTSFERLTSAVPSVVIGKNSGATKLYMRGIGSQGNAGMAQAMSVYIDDVYHGRSRNTKAALVDVERVEVLKGPQSVHFGLNSTAGTLAVISRRPELGEDQGYVDLALGSDDHYLVRGAYNGAIADHWAVRAVVESSEQGNIWQMIDSQGAQSGKGGGENNRVYRLSTLYQPDASLSFLLKLEQQNVEKQNPFAWQPGGCDNLYGLGLSTQGQLDDYWLQTGSNSNSPLAVPSTCQADFIDNQYDDRSPASPNNDSTFDYQATTFTINKQWTDVHLTAVSSYFDSGYQYGGNDLSHGADFHRLLWSQDDSRQWMQQVKLYSTAQADWQWLVGAYWHHEHTEYQLADADGRNNKNLQYRHSLTAQDEYAKAFYGVVDWSITDNLSMAVGLRYQQSDKAFVGVNKQLSSKQLQGAVKNEFSQVVLNDLTASPLAYQSFDLPIRDRFADNQLDFAHWQPSIDFRYQLNDTWRSYFKWTKGNKAGGFNFRLNNLTDETLSYDSETVYGHELGIKGSSLTHGLQFSAALFSSVYRDLQQNSNQDPLGGTTTAVIRNAAKAHSQGLELDGQWQISKPLTVSWSATWMQTEFDDYQGADCTRLQVVVLNTDVASSFGGNKYGQKGCSQNLSGKSLAMAPDFSSRLGVEYQYALSAGWLLTTRLEWLYSDGYFTSPHADSLRYQDSFSKYHGRLTLSEPSKHWQLSLLAYNLTNQYTSKQLGQDEDAAVSALLDMPRQYQLQLRYRF